MVAGLIAAVGCIHYMLGVDLQGKLNTARASQADADSFNSVMVALTVASLAVGVITGIAVMRWLWRSLNNAWHLDAGDGISSPRMSVVAWLIPIYSLVRPYQIVIDLHDRLLSPLYSTSGRRLIKAWWALWILGTVFGDAAMFTARSGGSSPTGLDRMGTVALLGVLSAFSVADAVLAIAVVRQVQRLSDAREMARRGYPAPAIELVSSSQRPRVTRVPVVLAAAAIVALVAPLGIVYAGASASPAWITFQPADKKFTVSMPVTPVEKPIAPHESDGITISGDVFQAGENGTLAFDVSYYDYPAGSFTDVSPQIVLESLRTGLADEGTIESASDRTIDGRPALELQATIVATHVRAIYCVDGDRVYVVEADYTAAEAGSPDIDRFLTSFALP